MCRDIGRLTGKLEVDGEILEFPFADLERVPQIAAFEPDLGSLLDHKVLHKMLRLRLPFGVIGGGFIFDNVPKPVLDLVDRILPVSAGVHGFVETDRDALGPGP
jgi:hypothetical protein